ncbi:hypothetical protein EVG20_g8752 [Dentipellis fragilis]|uniref:Protein kinase domain-containing protein n=1 Tax=Dentipellis fragilis TaxID=205917 RepID=A0A4Y9Y361_9AGAM|nr:hypothetical protein EVG20_g8752 [Dentipellis fragilis]
MAPSSPKTASDFRYRVIRQEWVRDKDGDWLPRPPPAGTRTPSGLIWGHELDDFFHIGRKPGVSVITSWSRSMIMEFGKDHPTEIAPHTYEEELAREPKPRLRKPWPVLKVRKEKGKGKGRAVVLDPPVDAIDEGSGHEDEDEDEDYGSYEVRPGSWDLEDERAPQGFDELKRGPEAGDPFKLDGIPKLEQFIPEAYFPDYILVHDPQDVCSGRAPQYNMKTQGDTTKTEDNAAPKRFKRVFPTDEMLRERAPSRKITDEDRPNVAHLYVNKHGVMGEGHHSMAYRASVRLPYPLSAHSPNKQVTVAMKVAMERQSARDMLKNEATVYNSFPRYLMEDWCGYNLCTPDHAYPVPATAVVPKFFGYYVPDFEKEKKSKAEDGDGTQDKDEETGSKVEDEDHNASEYGSDYSTSNHRSDQRTPSPILLMEDCGVPIIPKNFGPDTRTEIFSLALRLHVDGFVQNSFFTRNILMQPGPLTLPPNRRTLDHPSFRVIDFGRAEMWDELHNGVLDSHIRQLERERVAKKAKEAKESEEKAKEGGNAAGVGAGEPAEPEAMEVDEEITRDKLLRGDNPEVEKMLNGLGRKWWDKRRIEKDLARQELGMDMFDC